MVRKYTVADFLQTKTPNTRKKYASSLASFARFLNLDEKGLFEYANNPDSPFVTDMSRYIESRDTKHANKPAGTTKNYVSVVKQFLEINDVVFKKQELSVFKVKSDGAETRELHLTQRQLQEMFTAADLKGKCLLTLLVSTGARINQLLQVELRDLDLNCRPAEIHFRKETIKGGKKYTGFLTDEATQILKLWLKERQKYILSSQDRNRALVESGIAKSKKDPANDPRLLPFHYETARSVFTTLLKKTVPIKSHLRQEWGEYYDEHTQRGRYRIHDLRKYFRRHAIDGMDIDAAEQLLNHTGYLQGAYTNRDSSELAKIFLAGQQALTIFPHELISREFIGELDLVKSRNEILEKKVIELTKKTDGLLVAAKYDEHGKVKSGALVRLNKPEPDDVKDSKSVPKPQGSLALKSKSKKMMNKS